MQCYKDKTFCNFDLICKNGQNCDRAMTKEESEEAEKNNIPVCMFSDFPDCFVRWFE